MAETNIYLVRHAQTEANLKKLVSGWADTPLTSHGRTQAVQSGRDLAGVEFGAILTSDLSRTKDTGALILGENHGATPNPSLLWELREQHYGGFDMRPGSDLWASLADELGFDYEALKGTPKLFELFQSTPTADFMNALAVSDPTGRAEDWAAFSERVTSAVEAIGQVATQNAGGNVLVVSHGGTIRTLLDLMDPAGSTGQVVGNASISIIDHAPAPSRFNIRQVGVEPGVRKY